MYPNQPPGFVKFKWKTAVFNKGSSNSYTGQLCPECSTFGFEYGPQGFTDKFAMALARLSRKKKIWNGWLVEIKPGEYLRDHWSRYCLGECIQCGCKLWHDFRCGCSQQPCSCGDWHYYYKPKGQLTLGEIQ